MNFLETLRSVGGVKPCPCGGIGRPTVMFGREVDARDLKRMCPNCHGTGQILDLAPLLAKPRMLVEHVHELIERKESGIWKMVKKKADFSTDNYEVGNVYDDPSIFVVGPQRAHSLVYEVARQLGGSAVVAEPTTEMREIEQGLCEGLLELRITGYRLSIPILPDATVLFVTDRLDEQEMQSVMQCVSNPIRWLPYILAIVSNQDTLEGGPRGMESMKIIALHKEAL